VKLLGSARLDHWRLFDASRIERDRATGTTTLANTFPDRDGTTVNGRLGASIALTEKWRVRATGYTGFRVPTLNELYRPFRVGNAVTEANAQLEPERLIGGEASVEWRPADAMRLSGTAFYNRLEDAVGNITIGFGPGIFDPGGFIPAGGVLRQRQNVDLVVAPGAEFTGEWSIAPSLLIRGTYLFTEPTIERAAETSLIGNLLAQTPQHVGTAAIEWRPARKWLLSAQGRYLDRQFEDDQNSIELAAVWLVDAAIAYDFTEKLSAAVKIENVLNAEVETGKTINGLVSIGAPRLVSLQVRCGF
jgi:outer membrane receptor protein involved in Fe transport